MKKFSFKIISLLIVLILLLIIIPSNKSIAETSGNYTYTETDTGVTITKYNGSETNVSIPSQINKKNVTEIGNNAFGKNTTIKSVTIPNTVKKIGTGAFADCTNLSTVNLGTGLESIYSYAFQSTKIQILTIPASVTSVNELAMFGCRNFTDYKVNSGNTKYKDINGVLFSKDGETLISYPAGKKDLSYTIPEGTVYIGESAFTNNIVLTNINFAKTIDTIYEYAFYNCEKIVNLVVPANVKHIKPEAFGNMDSLKTVDLKANITLLELDMFRACNLLEKVTLPETLITIRNYAFVECPALKYVKIPKSVLLMYSSAFDDISVADLSQTNLEENDDGTYVVLENVAVEGSKDYDRAYQVLEIINEERAKEKLSPLKMDKNLLEVAMERAAEISISYSHTRPNGQDVSSLVKIKYSALGENITRNLATAEDAMKSWMNSSGHKANILSEDFTSVGVGCVKVRGVTQWVQVFTDSVAQEGAKPKNVDVTYNVKMSSTQMNMKFVNSEVTLEEGKTQSNYLLNTSLVGGYKGEEIKISQYKVENTNPSVAKVDDYGEITALKEGKTTIKVTTPKGYTFSYTINVYRPRIAFTQKEIKIAVGESIKITQYIKMDPDRAYGIQYVTYESSDSSIALPVSYPAYNEFGITYGKKEGIVTITAILPNGEKGTCKLIVGNPKEIPFTDVKETDYYYGSVVYTYENKIIKGKSDTIFAPKANITRGELVTILYRMEGSPKIGNKNPFTDVKEGTFYYNGVIWASENGIVSGYGNGKFGANDPIKRAQLATILYNYARYKKVDLSKKTDITTYKDYTTVKNKTIYALDALKWAIGSKIMKGTDEGNINPTAYATRGQVAVMITNYCNKMKK